jgi:hypothetical protein
MVNGTARTRCEGGVEPLKPTIDTNAAAHIRPTVTARILRGVSQPM